MNEEMKNTVDRDCASRFSAEQYRGSGCYLHIHNNLEIYGVIKGTVSVTIAGHQAVLTDGQMAVIDGLESHSYEINGEAEMFFFHIGTQYSTKLYSLYPNRRLPFFLMDAKFNKQLYAQIQPLFDNTEKYSEMKRLGVVYQLFAEIIDRYGMVEKSGNVADDCDIVANVVQYIYDHYNEPISLESLSRAFFISPKALSKKIRKRLNMDLRLFINDIRIQRAVQMREDPAYKGKSLSEIATLCGFTNMGTFYRSYERNFKPRKMDTE